MRIVCISDTHSMHRKLSIPNGDLLIHAGDISDHGELDTLDDFCKWLHVLPYKHKIIIAGNHDFFFQKEEHRTRSIKKINGVAHYLEDTSIMIDGITFYGSPWQPNFFNWAFNLPRGSALRNKWKLINTNTQVLITHGPPHNILDTCPGGSVGDEALATAIGTLSHLRYHIFGHIHESYGTHLADGVTYINASICTSYYEPTNKPIAFTFFLEKEQ